jgi:hypothetical protein
MIAPSNTATDGALRRARAYIDESDLGYEPVPGAQRGGSWYVFKFVHPDILGGRVDPMEMPGAGLFVVVPDDPTEPVSGYSAPLGLYFHQLTNVGVDPQGN